MTKTTVKQLLVQILNISNLICEQLVIMNKLLDEKQLKKKNNAPKE